MVSPVKDVIPVKSWQTLCFPSLPDRKHFKQCQKFQKMSKRKLSCHSSCKQKSIRHHSHSPVNGPENSDLRVHLSIYITKTLKKRWNVQVFRFKKLRENDDLTFLRNAHECWLLGTTFQQVPGAHVDPNISGSCTFWTGKFTENCEKWPIVAKIMNLFGMILMKMNY